MNKAKPQPLLGAHFSIAKGLHKAILEAEAYGCNTLQIFTKNANAWKERQVTDAEIEKFNATMAKTRINQIASHTSYLINLAAADKEKHEKACHALKQELIRSSALSIPYVVHHPGAHMGNGIEAGIQQIADSINRVIAQIPKQSARLLLETTAGQGSSVGHKFQHIVKILEKIEQPHLMGVCLDTCHIFAAGYDIRTKSAFNKTLKHFNDIIGLKSLNFIHLNDAKRELGSRVDRHQHIGEGQIGLDAFSYFMNDKRLRNIPKVIETEKGEKGEDWDRMNLERLRSLIN